MKQIYLQIVTQLGTAVSAKVKGVRLAMVTLSDTISDGTPTMQSSIDKLDMGQTEVYFACFKQFNSVLSLFLLFTDL